MKHYLILNLSHALSWGLHGSILTPTMERLIIPFFQVWKLDMLSLRQGDPFSQSPHAFWLQDCRGEQLWERAPWGVWVRRHRSPLHGPWAGRSLGLEKKARPFSVWEKDGRGVDAIF